MFIEINVKSPDCSRRYPDWPFLFSVYFGDDLSAEEHDVGAGLDHVRDEMLVILLQLERVLVKILSVLDVGGILGVA